MSGLPHAEPLPHCQSVGVIDPDRGLVAMLTLRQTYDYAAELIRSADAVRKAMRLSADPPGQGTARFDQEFGTRTAAAAGEPLYDESGCTCGGSISCTTTHHPKESA